MSRKSDSGLSDEFVDELYQDGIDFWLGRNRKEVAEKLRELAQIAGGEATITPEMIDQFIAGEVKLQAGRPKLTREQVEHRAPTKMDIAATTYDDRRKAQKEGREPKLRSDQLIDELANEFSVDSRSLRNHIYRSGRKRKIRK